MLHSDVDVRLDAPGAGLVSNPAAPDLEPAVARVEQHLAALADSLRERDAQLIDLRAHELHRALAQAVECFMHAARNGGVPDTMRRRLAHASAQLARQRESLSRATAALDRAIDVLMPGDMPAGKVYTASGLAVPLRTGGALNA